MSFVRWTRHGQYLIGVWSCGRKVAHYYYCFRLVLARPMTFLNSHVVLFNSPLLSFHAKWYQLVVPKTFLYSGPKQGPLGMGWSVLIIKRCSTRDISSWDSQLPLPFGWESTLFFFFWDKKGLIGSSSDHHHGSEYVFDHPQISSIDEMCICKYCTTFFNTSYTK